MPRYLVAIPCALLLLAGCSSDEPATPSPTPTTSVTRGPSAPGPATGAEAFLSVPGLARPQADGLVGELKKQFGVESAAYVRASAEIRIVFSRHLTDVQARQIVAYIKGRPEITAVWYGPDKFPIPTDMPEPAEGSPTQSA